MIPDPTFVSYEHLAVTIHIHCGLCGKQESFPCSSRVHRECASSGARGPLSHSINIMYHLALYCTGVGPQVIRKVLSVLGVRFGTFERTSSSKNADERVQRVCREVAKESCLAALQAEVNVSQEATAVPVEIGEPTDVRTKTLRETTATISVLADGCWLTRGAGGAFASYAGALTVFGGILGKIIYAMTYCKMCAFCEWHIWNHPDEPIPDHTCHIGGDPVYGPADPVWRGPSGVMEPSGCVEAVLTLGELGVKCGDWVGDEDCKISSALRDTKLVPQTFVSEFNKVSDPNHRVKNLKKGLRLMEKGGKRGSRLTVEQGDYLAKRYMAIIKENRGRLQVPGVAAPPHPLSKPDAVAATIAGLHVMTHHEFGRHELCGNHWVRMYM